jgi:molybdopterin adenylyltransferase
VQRGAIPNAGCVRVSLTTKYIFFLFFLGRGRSIGPEQVYQNTKMTNTKDQYSLGILTISDAGSKGEREDTSGDAIVEIMIALGFRIALRDIVPDEPDLISERLRDWCDAGEIDVVLTTGGTGLGPRDVTPEATRAVIELEVPGIAEAMRMLTIESTPMAMLSRSVAGIRAGCLIVNLPGSPKAVRETLAIAIQAIPHALEMIRGWRTHPTQPVD